MIEILFICSLTAFAPYYDCDTTWEIWLTPDYPHCLNPDYKPRACVWYNQDFILGHHVIKISKRHQGDVLFNGETVLWHELKHAICYCDNDPWSMYNET